MPTGSPSTPTGTPTGGASTLRAVTGTLDDLEDNFKSLAKDQPDLEVIRAGIGRFPVSLAGQIPNPHAVGAYVVIKDRQAHQHTVSLEVGEPSMNGRKMWSFFCGHPWMHGSEQARRTNVAFGEWAKNTAQLKAGPVDELMNAMGHTFAIAKADPVCPFLTGSAAVPKFACDHSRFAAHLFSDPSGPLQKVFNKAGVQNLPGLLMRMEVVYGQDREVLSKGGTLTPWQFDMDLVSRPKIKPAPVHTAPVRVLDPRDSEILAEETRFRSTGRLASQVLDLTSHFNGTPVPVLIAGPGGWGKTFLSRDMGQSEKLFQHYAEIPVTPGTEMRDLVGGIYPTLDPVTKEKHFTHVDGPLTQAMREAQTKRTLLLMDEVGNLDSRGWNMMKNLLNPSRGQYTLATDAPVQGADGHWGLSKISVPTKNLVVMMTANIGEGYDGALGDPAVRSRLVTIPFGPTRETVKSALCEGDKDAIDTMAESKAYLMGITKKSLAARGFSESMAKKFEKVWDGAVSLVSDDQLYQLPSPRNYARAIETAATEDDLGKQLLYQAGNWARLRVDFYPNQAQTQAAKTLVERSFA